MKVSGFTFLRNAVANGFPFEESITSILPIVDEFICVVGDGDDDTLDRVYAIESSKIRVIQSQWNESMRDRGFVYGQQKKKKEPEQYLLEKILKLNHQICH